MEKYARYRLPIGTVVTLKGVKPKLMINGFSCCNQAEKDIRKKWDYRGCIYPQGIIRTDSVVVFNHSQIEEVHFLGFTNSIEKEFKDKLVYLLYMEKVKAAKRPIPSNKKYVSKR